MINFFNPYLIAEIGVNHEGCIEKARMLISEAKRCGFSAIKLQHIITSKVWHESFPVEKKLSQKESLPDAWLCELVEYCNELGINIGCTPTFQGSAKTIKESKCDFIKLASPQAKYDLFILDECLETNLPIIVSNGYCNLEESMGLIKYLTRFSNSRPVAFLYCVAHYPADEVFSNLEDIKTIAEECANTSIAFGLSDHNQNMFQALQMKYSYNGTVFEKHFSDEDCTSLDKDVSIFSWQAKEYVRQLTMKTNISKKSRSELFINKSSIFASSFYLRIDVNKNQIFNIDDCSRMRDGISDNFDTAYFWSFYRSNREFRYTRDLKQGSRIGKGDLK